ncbi:protein qua-1-like isoform X12 [Drosophila navojoa]|uniref:protein qua-1-like isoform X12 n=1 Tax=Drosophila navojoa TaxID=7232 RepID=UPI0011BF818E|nr:protein qua-1-like isoform X12 [Drosophila navojoa]
MGFDLERICCLPPSSSSSSTTKIFCNDNYNKCSQCCCYPCCRQSLLNDHTYSLLKRICHKIIKSYNRQQCREKYTVFNGGYSINGRCSDGQKYDPYSKNHYGDGEGGYGRDSQRGRGSLDLKAQGRNPSNKKGGKGDEFGSQNNASKNGDPKGEGKMNLAALSRGEKDSKGKKGDADDSDPSKKSKKEGKGGDGKSGGRDADDSEPAKKSKKDGKGGDGKGSGRDADERDTSNKSKRASKGADGKGGGKNTDDSDPSNKSKKDGKETDGKGGGKDADDSDPSKKSKRARWQRG